MTKWSASDRDKESTALPKVMSACSHASSSERTAAETSIFPASGQTVVSVVQLQATGVQGANFRILYKDGPTRKMICSRVGCLFVFVLVCGCRPAAVCAVCAVCVWVAVLCLWRLPPSSRLPALCSQTQRSWACHGVPLSSSDQTMQSPTRAWAIKSRHDRPAHWSLQSKHRSTKPSRDTTSRATTSLSIYKLLARINPKVYRLINSWSCASTTKRAPAGEFIDR